MNLLFLRRLLSLSLCICALALLTLGVGCAGGGTDGTGLEVRVFGMVVTPDGEPFVGVVEGASGQAEVDPKGEFTLTVPRGSALAFKTAAGKTLNFSLDTIPAEASSVSILFEVNEESEEVKAIDVVVEEVDPTPTAGLGGSPSPSEEASTPASSSPSDPTEPAGPTSVPEPTSSPPATTPDPEPTGTLDSATPPGVIATPTPTATPEPTPTFPLGDMNCDGVTNCDDVEPFTTALTEPAVYASQYPDCDRMLGDVDGNGVFNNFDIDPFFALAGDC